MLAPSALLRLLPGHDSRHWHATIPPHLCVGQLPHQFLFGGTSLAACLTALEETLNLPVSFASAQFISFARANETMAFDVQLLAGGRNIKQAQITAHVGDRLIVTVQAALGRRDHEQVHQGGPAPVVAGPLECPLTPVARLLSSNMNALVEVRLAGGRLPGRTSWSGTVPGPVTFWARARDGSMSTRQHLAVLADFLSIGIPAALGFRAGGNSLDNHIRFVAPPDGQWVLCAIEIEAVRDGLVHGQMRQYAQDGRLLALAGQSMILRIATDSAGST